jgi:hypothetical protein
MDEEGYLPIAFVANYPNVACYGAPYQDLITKLKERTDGPLDIDLENETIRLKEGWEKVRSIFL